MLAHLCRRRCNHSSVARRARASRALALAQEALSLALALAQSERGRAGKGVRALRGICTGCVLGGASSERDGGREEEGGRTEPRVYWRRLAPLLASRSRCTRWTYLAEMRLKACRVGERVSWRERGGREGGRGRDAHLEEAVSAAHEARLVVRGERARRLDDAGVEAVREERQGQRACSGARGCGRGRRTTSRSSSARGQGGGVSCLAEATKERRRDAR